MCKCKNIEIQSYDRQTSMKMPTWRRKDGWVCIDTCLVQEIAELWQLWIKTTWCCCWHNRKDWVPWFIGVIDQDIQKMKDLWYKVQENPCRPWDEDSFFTKTVY